MNRQQGRRIKPLKQRRWKFDDELLDRFEDLEARRQAGHRSYQACMARTPEYYAFQADGAQQHHRLPLHFNEPVPNDGLGAPSEVLSEPILARVTQAPTVRPSANPVTARTSRFNRCFAHGDHEKTLSRLTSFRCRIR